MRIALLTRYFDYRGTGVTRISTEIHKRLTERGHEVCTVSTKGNSLYSYLLYTALEIPFRLPRDMDVYHALTTLEGMWVPKGRSIVTYLDLMPILNLDRFGSGMGYSRWKGFVGSRYAHLGCRVASRHTILTCISEMVKEQMVEHLGISCDKIRVVRLGIRDDLEPSEKQDDTFRVGTLGQLDKRKRIDLLIKEFRRSRIDGELVIAGTGMDEPKLRRLAEGDRRIRFLGLVPDDRLCEFLNSLSVFIFPTWVEGYGLPCIEAMACRKPVIVLSDAIIPWEVKSRCVIVEDLGVLFGNPAYMENLCKYVDYDGNYQFAKEHSWDRTVEEYIELYKEIIG